MFNNLSGVKNNNTADLDYTELQDQSNVPDDQMVKVHKTQMKEGRKYGPGNI